MAEPKRYRFNDFEIRKPTFIGDPPSPDYYDYNFDVVKWSEYDGKEYCFSIGTLRFDKHEGSFEFESVGLRYLEDREDGLEKYLLDWCEKKEK